MEAQRPGAAILSEALLFPLASEESRAWIPSSPETWPACMPFLVAPFLLSSAQRCLSPPLPQDSFLSEHGLPLETGSLLSLVVSAFHLAKASEVRKSRVLDKERFRRGRGAERERENF